MVVKAVQPYVAQVVSYRMRPVATRKHRGDDVSDLLRMICHIADENAREVKLAEQSRGRARAAMTNADMEARDWDAFVKRLEWRQRVVRGENFGETDQNSDADAFNEEDLDMLVVLVGLFEGKPLTLTEVVRGLQAKRVLTMEFAAAARAQANRLLVQLRDMGRLRRDSLNRWVLA